MKYSFYETEKRQRLASLAQNLRIPGTGSLPWRRGYLTGVSAGMNTQGETHAQVWRIAEMLRS